MCDEMMQNAKSMERAAAASAASTSGRFMGRFQSLPAGSVSVQRPVSTHSRMLFCSHTLKPCEHIHSYQGPQLL